MTLFLLASRQEKIEQMSVLRLPSVERSGWLKILIKVGFKKEEDISHPSEIKKDFTGQADTHRQKADGRFSCGGLARRKGCHACGI